MSKIITLIIVVVVIVAAAFFALQNKRESVASIVTVNSDVIDFTLKDFDGNDVALSDFRGTPVMIDFWSVWCPFCIDEMPEIEKIHKEFGDDLVVIGIHRTTTEDLSRGQEFAKELGITYILLQDTTDEVYEFFLEGRSFMPFAVYLDEEGKIISTKAGQKTAEEMRENVNKLLSK